MLLYVLSENTFIKLLTFQWQPKKEDVDFLLGPELNSIWPSLWENSAQQRQKENLNKIYFTLKT